MWVSKIRLYERIGGTTRSINDKFINLSEIIRFENRYITDTISQRAKN